MVPLKILLWGFITPFTLCTCIVLIKSIDFYSLQCSFIPAKEGGPQCKPYSMVHIETQLNLSPFYNLSVDQSTEWARQAQCLTTRFEMPCLFLGQMEFHVLIIGGAYSVGVGGGGQSSWFLVWSDTVKRSGTCALNGCRGNYNKPFCLHRGTIPSHLLFHSNLISIERLAAREMTLMNHSPFPQNWAEACWGKSIELCGHPAPPFASQRAVWLENGLAEIEVITN